MAKFSTLEGRAHQGGQGGSPSADLQSPRKPPGSPQPAPLDGGGRPAQRGPQPPHTFHPLAYLGSSRTPTISWTSPPPGHSGPFSRVIPMLKTLTGAKGANRVPRKAGGLPLGPHGPPGAQHTLYTRSSPTRPVGKKATQGGWPRTAHRRTSKPRGCLRQKGLQVSAPQAPGS